MFKRLLHSKPSGSVLAWSAGKRLRLTLPLLALLWLAVWWANAELAPL
jgi:hypothetical protein